MSDDLETAARFLEVLQDAAQTGNHEAVFPFLAVDVEWVTPGRTFNGIEELQEQVNWGSPRTKLDVEFEERALSDLGDGRGGVESPRDLPNEGNWRFRIRP